MATVDVIFIGIAVLVHVIIILMVVRERERERFLAFLLRIGLFDMFCGKLIL